MRRDLKKSWFTDKRTSRSASRLLASAVGGAGDIRPTPHPPCFLTRTFQEGRDRSLPGVYSLQKQLQAPPRQALGTTGLVRVQRLPGRMVFGTERPGLRLDERTLRPRDRELV